VTWGGLIVIDFIDMTSRKHQREVEECLRSAMQIDKARVQIGRISRFGLLEMSRQRLRPSLGESSQETCPRCEGHGTIRSVESLALSILRLVEDEVMKDYTGQIIVQAPTEVINFLHNEKRTALAEVELRHKVPIVMLANQYLVTPHFEILRVRKSDVSSDASYTRIDQPEAQVIANERSQANAVVIPAPAVKRIVPDSPAPIRTEEKAPGLFSRLANMLFSHPQEEEKSKPAPRKKTTQKGKTKRSGQQNRRRPAQSSQQQSNRKVSKKRSSKKPQAGGQQKQQQQRTSKKRAAKKTQSKPVQGKPAQSKNEQKQTGKSKTSQKQRRPQQANKGAVKKSQTSVNDNNQQADIQTTPTGGDIDGNVKPEQKESSSRRGGRRRRSPYKTGGAKPRPERSESAVDTTVDSSAGQKTPISDKQKATESSEKPAQVSTPASKPKAAKATAASSEARKPISKDSSENEPKPSNAKPVEAKPVEAKPVEAKPVKTKPVKTKPVKTKPVKTKPVETKPVETKPVEAKPAKQQPTGPSKDDSKPAKTIKRAPGKKAASKKKASKKTPASSKPAAIPKTPSPMAPERDSKGIYTLKPPPSG